MLWYLLNFCIIFVFIILFLITRQTNKRWSKINDYLGMVTNTVNSVRYGNLSTKIDEINHPTYQNVTDSINRMVETLNDREKMIVEYQAELMRQNKLLESVINSLSDGILIINDKHNIAIIATKSQIFLFIFYSSFLVVINYNYKNIVTFIHIILYFILSIKVNGNLNILGLFIIKL